MEQPSPLSAFAIRATCDILEWFPSSEPAQMTSWDSKLYVIMTRIMIHNTYGDTDNIRCNIRIFHLCSGQFLAVYKLHT